MKFVKLVISATEQYFYKESSSIEMNVLGDFLASDVGYHSSSFREWVFDDKSDNACGNLTTLEKVDGYILLIEMYSEEKVPAVLGMTRDQFINLLDDWQKRVCGLQPKEVIIKYENDQYIFETKD